MRENEFEKIKYYLRLIISNSNDLIQSNKLVQKDCDDLKLLSRVFTTLDKIESQFYFDKVYVNASAETEPIYRNVVEEKRIIKKDDTTITINEHDLDDLLKIFKEDETKTAVDSITILDSHFNHQLAIKIRTLQDEITVLQNQLTLNLLSTNPVLYYKLNDELRDKQQAVADAYKQLGY